MTNPAATLATFSDFRIVKTRKLAQFVFEVPIEDADKALAALGGLPRSDGERWCGIALITKSASPEADAGHDSTVTLSSAKAGDGGLSAPEPAPSEAVAGGAPPVLRSHSEAGKQRRHFSELPLPTQAALLSQDERFQKWILPICTDGDRTELAAQEIRVECAVGSRADIKPGTQAAERFARLLDNYYSNTGQTAEQRS